MPASPEAIAETIRRATEPGFRGRLIARGQSRAMIRRDGIIPDGSPRYTPSLSYDLLAYGYGLLTQGLRLIEHGEQLELARTACASAAEALEAAITNAAHSPDLAFHRVMAASAYHVGRYSARAYSLLSAFDVDALDASNVSPIEQVLALLMLRRIDRLDSLVSGWCLGERADDDRLHARLSAILPDEPRAVPDEAADNELGDIADIALTAGFMSASATALLAFERGERALLDAALERFDEGLSDADQLNMVPQWWAHRMARHLFDELWGCSFHAVLPKEGGPDLPDWTSLRGLFVASLHSRSRAEIDLWPSQIDAAAKALQVDQNLVVSLPTSAGKTRIGELCILACLAAGKRVMFITPLRALSAQTEVALNRTFRPLGKTVSGLYGSIGVSEADQGLMTSRDIVVATPEKLDFALRNDPSLLDDVGLVILDEGHMIGLNEREVRYEVQIQRLLRRADANQRRIVCLSAILPDGDQLEDFVGWLAGDVANGLVQKDWRPTRLRFGDVEWRQDRARLSITMGDETPYVPRFFNAKTPTKGKRKKMFPADQRELVLATAWTLIDDGQTVLIFCPRRRSVEPFAKAVVDLHRWGLVEPLIDEDDPRLDKALAIGAEWMGDDHVLLQALRLGVAVHHGALPTPYRREVEALLRDGVLKLTISSPTLAQGLNLAATTLLFQGLHREKDVIAASDFKNIIGRAGRAFVDVQGLVLYPMFDNPNTRRAAWAKLVGEAGKLNMESGLLRLVGSLLARLQNKLGTQDLKSLMDYILGMPDWTFSALPGEDVDTVADEARNWGSYITYLDTAVLSMLGEDDVADADIEAALDTALASSLWTRRIARAQSEAQPFYRQLLIQRARFIWGQTTAAQRRGYFLAGLGLETGQQLDFHSDALIELLLRANGGVSTKDAEAAIQALTTFAEIVFEIAPFKPNSLPADWRDLLRAWLEGRPMRAFVGGDSDVLRFIEDAFLYRLPWALESVRVHGMARNYTTANGLTLDDFVQGLAPGVCETGVLNRSAMVLIQSGFASRSGAQKAVADGEGEFESLGELKAWLRTPEVMALNADPSWPTPETRDLWLEFVGGLRPELIDSWARQDHRAAVAWRAGAPRDGLALRLKPGTTSQLVDADYTDVGILVGEIKGGANGLLTITARSGCADLTYLGPDDLDADLL